MILKKMKISKSAKPNGMRFQALVKKVMMIVQRKKKRRKNSLV